MVAQARVGAVLDEVLAGAFNVAGNDSAADNNVLIGDLLGVDVHKHQMQIVTRHPAAQVATLSDRVAGGRAHCRACCGRSAFRLQSMVSPQR